MKETFNEISRLEPMDIFYVGERIKTFFEYPAHCHEVYELNFVENAAGVVRTIGDSRETIGNLDLVFITGSKLVHVWNQGTCPQHEIHEITIHIDPAIQIIREDIINVAVSTDSFAAVMRLLNLLYRLSLVEHARELSSSAFVNAAESNEDKRISKAKEYITTHYMQTISLRNLADLTCMSEDAFSKFFRHKTGRTPNRYIIDYRLGIAARMLLTTKLSVSEIGYACGFNTLSHFNRLFRESKGCTPSEFREQF